MKLCKILVRRPIFTALKLFPFLSRTPSTSTFVYRACVYCQKHIMIQYGSRSKFYLISAWAINITLTEIIFRCEALLS